MAKTWTSARTQSARTRASNSQDGEDVGILRSPAYNDSCVTSTKLELLENNLFYVLRINDSRDKGVSSCKETIMWSIKCIKAFCPSTPGSRQPSKRNFTDYV